MKLLSLRAHGTIDYVFAAILVLAPMVMHFGAAAATVSYVAAAVYLGVSLMTNNPLGAVKKIPASIHAAIELSLGLVLAASPWMFRFSHVAAERRFFVVAGLALLGLVAMTRYSRRLSKAATFDRYGE